MSNALIVPGVDCAVSFQRPRRSAVWWALLALVVGLFGELLTRSLLLRLRVGLLHLSRTLQYKNPFSGEAGLRISTGSCSSAEKSTEFWGRFLARNPEFWGRF